MKQGWEIKKLVDISSHLGDGLHGTPKYTPDGDYYFINGNNLTDGVIEFKESTKRVSIDEYKKYKKNLTDRTILVSINGTLGNVAFYNNEKIILGKSACYFNLLESVNKNFIKYILSSPYFLNYAHKEATGATIKNVSLKTMREFEIPTPPLPEQQRIVAILDQAFAAIAKAKINAEQNLKNAKELFESYLQGVFENKGKGWEEKTLSEVLEKTETIDPTKKPKEKFIYLDVSSVNKETKEIENATMLMGKDAPSRARKLIRTNDVIFATVRPTHSRVALITEEYNEQVCSTGYFVLRAKEFLNNNFVFYFLLTYDFNKQMEKLQKGASYPAVTDSEVKSIIIPFPKSLKEQQTIVKKLDALSAETKKLEVIYQQKINDLEELKKSILQKAFAGELTASLTSKKSVAKVISLQKLEGISTTDLQAGITAIALTKHIEKQQHQSFHHVKAEKIIHLSEYILNIDLERNPLKDAAGPNDFTHAKKVESRARKAAFYTVYKNGEHYDYKQGNSINTIIQKTNNCLGGKANLLCQIIDILIPMKTQQAEIVATVYAAWNNLKLRGNPFTDEEIVTEARENWHTEKLKIPREKFFNAIEWMRKNEILIPKGNGKIVLTK